MKKSELKELIKECLNEGGKYYSNPEDVGEELAMALDELADAIKGARDIATWGENKHRSARPMIETIERLTKTVGKM